MPQFYEPGRIIRSRQSRTPLEGLCTRLRTLGATASDVQGVVDAWDDWPADFDYSREQLLGAGDAVLRELIEANNAEYEYGTMAEDEHLAWLREQAPARLAAPVLDVVTWVAGDPTRARVLAEVERMAAKPRVTLLRQLDATAGA